MREETDSRCDLGSQPISPDPQDPQNPQDPLSPHGGLNMNAPDFSKRALYAAFASGDARFDGQVFVGVSSTGIYCRPVCRARMPKYENCTFFASAAEAEAAGFRPCMTCRPELAPGLSNVDARSSLARRTAAYLRDNCASSESIPSVAAKLGYTDRHVRRVFGEEFHVTPQRYRQTARLLLAKQLLTDTAAPLSQVARASGFSSVRTFNHSFRENYHLTPSEVRRRHGAKKAGEEGISMRLSYRPPYRFDLLLAFFRGRALLGVEKVDGVSYSRTVRLPDGGGGFAAGWVRVEDEPSRSVLRVTMSESLFPVVTQVLARIRRQFDLDCDPLAIQQGIASLDEAVPGTAVAGTRLPGCFDPFETCCRAILGQQVSVALANKLAARIVGQCGHAVETGKDGLTHAFPTPEDVLGFKDVEETFGNLGVIRTRSRVIAELARLTAEEGLFGEGGCVFSDFIDRLLAVKGIGPWSANYIAMRCAGYPDAFMETDAGIKHALPTYTPKERLVLAEQWRPWRSYATICLWNSLGQG